MDDIRTLKSKINREYFEYYAKYSLIMSRSKKYVLLAKNESPDWQSDVLNIGVEVTRAIDKDIYLAYNIIGEYFGNVFVKNHIDEKIKERQEEYAAILGCDNPQSICYDDISNIANLKKGYIHKTIKLNKNYVKYNKNQLYIFTFKSMDEYEVKECFDLDLSIYRINYDLCFVNCLDRLYVCDFVNKNIIDTIFVNAGILQKIKKKALKKSNLYPSESTI